MRSRWAPPNRHTEFDEGDDGLSPIRGVFDNAKNPPLPYTAAVGAIPLGLEPELHLVLRRASNSAHLPRARQRARAA